MCSFYVSVRFVQFVLYVVLYSFALSYLYVFMLHFMVQ